MFVPGGRASNDTKAARNATLLQRSFPWDALAWGGGGAHTLFMRTWATGLAYSSGVTASVGNFQRSPPPGEHTSSYPSKLWMQSSRPIVCVSWSFYLTVCSIVPWGCGSYAGEDGDVRYYVDHSPNLNSTLSFAASQVRASSPCLCSIVLLFVRCETDRHP